MLRRLTLLTLLLALPTLSAAGCGEEDSTSTTETGGGAATVTTTLEEDTVTSAEGGAADGASVFNANCTSCHGQEGTGGHVGPDLQLSTAAEDQTQVEDIVRNGRGSMPAFEGTLSDEQVNAVAEYVSTEIAPKQ